MRLVRAKGAWSEAASSRSPLIATRTARFTGCPPPAHIWAAPCISTHSSGAGTARAMAHTLLWMGKRSMRPLFRPFSQSKNKLRVRCKYGKEVLPGTQGDQDGRQQPQEGHASAEGALGGCRRCEDHDLQCASLPCAL